MLTVTDPLELDVLETLLDASGMRMRRCELRRRLQKLRSRYGSYGNRVFDVILQRKLKRLDKAGLVNKEGGLGKAHYSLKLGVVEEVRLLLAKQNIKRLVDGMAMDDLENMIDAAFKVINQERILRVLGVTEQSSVAEFSSVRARILYEMQRPRVGDLFLKKQDRKKES